jgi:hypothetical protein
MTDREMDIMTFRGIAIMSFSSLYNTIVPVFKRALEAHKRDPKSTLPLGSQIGVSLPFQLFSLGYESHNCATAALNRVSAYDSKFAELVRKNYLPLPNEESRQADRDQAIMMDYFYDNSISLLRVLEPKILNMGLVGELGPGDEHPNTNLWIPPAPPQ